MMDISGIEYLLALGGPALNSVRLGIVQYNSEYFGELYKYSPI